MTLLVYAAVVVRTAWLGDDAYITFRTIENFLAGYGLTWNTDERVQAYTHPLWMFLLAAVRAVSGEIYYTSLATSMALSLGSVLVVTLGIARTTGQALLVAAIFLSSKAFVDFSTSGLENPLSYLLVAWFLLVYLPDKGMTSRRLLRLSLLASLIVLNRMDLMLLVGPALLQAFWERRSLKALGWVVLGSLPFVAWEVFSVIYYGFPFPNTAYAKLNTGIPAGEMARQGFYYFVNSLRIDPLTLPVIGGALLAAIVGRRSQHLAIAAGMALYLLYVLKIGGCFMSGRLFAVPLLAAVGVLATMHLSRHAAIAAVAMPGVILLGLCGPSPSILSDSRCGCDWEQSLGSHKISDERAGYYQATGLLRYGPHTDVPSKPAAHLGIAAARAYLPVLSSTTVIGMAGYYAGPNVHVVDMFALPDPLLARLPMQEGYYRIGHFRRFVPDGYLEGLRSGRNELTDLPLRRFYNQLLLITRGPIFSAARWRTILDMNLGRCRHLIDTEYYRHPPPRLPMDLCASRDDPCAADLNLRLSPVGAWVLLGQTRHPSRIEITLDRSRACRILYPQGPAEPVEQPVPAAPSGSPVQTVQVPDTVSRTGFDRLLILPAPGDDACYVARIRILDPA